MKTRNDYINTIHNLLLKTAGNGCTEAEAESALLMAQKLMVKHHIELGEVQDQKSVAQVIRSSTGCKAMSQWAIRLLNLIAENFRCKSLISNSNAAFIGEEQDVAVAVDIYRMVYAIADRGTRKIRRQYRKEGKSTNGVADSYLIGFISGLRKAFDAQKVTEATNGGSFALALIIPDAVVKAHQEITANPDSKTIHGRGLKPSGDRYAFGKGYTDGNNSLNKQLQA